MSEVKSTFKFALFRESSCDPPAGNCILYYCAQGSNYEDLLWPISEIYDHFELSVFDEELDEFKETCENTIATKESISQFAWGNGGLDCACIFIAEGNEIASKVAEFFDAVLSECIDDEEYENISNVINTAVQNPENYDGILNMINMFSELIAGYNDSMLGIY